MRKNQSGLTTAGIVIVRAVESEKPVDERICNDPYASLFVLTKAASATPGITRSGLWKPIRGVSTPMRLTSKPVC